MLIYSYDGIINELKISAKPIEVQAVETVEDKEVKLETKVVAENAAEELIDYGEDAMAFGGNQTEENEATVKENINEFAVDEASWEAMQAFVCK